MNIEMMPAAAIRCSSVSEMSGYGLEDRGLMLSGGNVLFVDLSVRMALARIDLHIKWSHSSQLRQSHAILLLHGLRIRGALLQLPHTSPFARSLIDGDSFVHDSAGTYSISVMAVCVNFTSEAGDKIFFLISTIVVKAFLACIDYGNKISHQIECKTS